MTNTPDQDAVRASFEKWCPYKGNPDPWVVWQAAYQAGLAARVDGWQLVPIEPTEGMLLAVLVNTNHTRHDQMHGVV